MDFFCSDFSQETWRFLFIRMAYGWLKQIRKDLHDLIRYCIEEDDVRETSIFFVECEECFSGMENENQKLLILAIHIPRPVRCK